MKHVFLALLLLFSVVPSASAQVWYFNETDTRVWVLANVTAGTPTSFTISAGNGSFRNGSNVFTFFDDFEGNTLDTGRWDSINNGNPSPGNTFVGNGFVNISSSADTRLQMIRGKVLYGLNNSVHFRAATPGGTDLFARMYLGFVNTSQLPDSAIADMVSDGGVVVANASAGFISRGTLIYSNAFRHYEVARIAIGNTLFINETSLMENGSSSVYGGTTGANTRLIGFATKAANSTRGNLVVDYVFVRNISNYPNVSCSGNACVVNSTANLTNYAILLNTTTTGNLVITTSNGSTPLYTVQARDARTNTSISTFTTNISTNGAFTGSFNTTGGSINTNVSVNASNNYTFTTSATNYFTNTTTNPLAATVTTYLVGYTRINVSYFFGPTAWFQNFTVTWINTANTSENGTTSTTTGGAFLPLFNATYNVTISNATNGSVTLNSETQQLTANPYLENYTFVLFAQNTIIFTVRDEITKQVIFQPFTVNLLSDIAAYTINVNGSTNESVVVPTTYTLLTNSSDYATVKLIYTVVASSANNLSLYALTVGNATAFKFTVFDFNNKAVAGALLTLQRRNVNAIGYYTTQSCTTDNNGECVVNAELYNTQSRAIYRTYIDYRGQRVLDSGDQQFATNIITYRVNTNENFLRNFWALSNASASSLSFSNSTNTLTFTWSNPTNEVTQACIRVQTLQLFGYLSTTTYCSDGSTGSLTTPALNVSQDNVNMIYAQAFLTINGRNYLASTTSIRNTGATTDSGLAAWMFIIIPVALTLMFISGSNPTIALVIGGVSVLIFAATGLVSVPLTVLSMLAITLIIMVVKLRS